MAEALLMLKTVFLSLELRPDIAWEFLKDLRDDQVKAAVGEIIQTKVEIYPGTNWIALIRSVATRCRKCNGKGSYVSETNYDIPCDCKK